MPKYTVYVTEQVTYARQETVEAPNEHQAIENVMMEEYWTNCNGWEYSESTDTQFEAFERKE